MDQLTVVYLAILGVTVGLIGSSYKWQKAYFWRTFWCLLPLAIGAMIVVNAWGRYESGQGGFKLGVDLAGGTDLIYEIDMDKFPDRKLPDNYKPEQLVESLKRRIDPADLYNIKIRPVSNTRVEIVLPTGGRHQIEAEERAWQDLLERVRSEWPVKGYQVPVGNKELLKDRILDFAPTETFKAVDEFMAANYQPATEGDEKEKQAKNEEAWKKLLEKANEKWPARPYAAIARGDLIDLQTRVQQQYPKVTAEEFGEFIKGRYAVDKEGRSLTGAQVEQIKEKIRQVGSLEFRILANDRDDAAAIKAARKFFADAKNDGPDKRALQEASDLGQPPPSPRNATGGDTFPVTINDETTQHTYSWVEVGKSELHSLGLNSGNKDSEFWQRVAEARKKGELFDAQSGYVIFSRDITNPARLSAEDRGKKQYEYYILTRESLPGQEVTGQYLTNATSGVSGKGLKLAVHFTFSNKGANLFGDLTSRNRPSGRQTGTEFLRHLAIILDGQIMSAPVINQPITGGQGEISG
ncbi:MAG: hypothetical protein AB7K24_19355, partial [Gemmataceae bacterium]